MKIKTAQLLQYFISIYPNSREYFISNADDWICDNGRLSTHSLFSLFSYFVENKFICGEYKGAEQLFSFIENAISLGDEPVKNAVCTCFIENLINIASHENDFELSHFYSLMGPLAKEYADQWMAL